MNSNALSRTCCLPTPPPTVVKEAGQGIMADYVDYRRALNYRAIDVRASVPSASDVRPDPALWWEGAVVVRAAVALGLGTLVSSIGQAGLMAPWTEVLMQTACERQNITYPSDDCNQSPLAQVRSPPHPTPPKTESLLEMSLRPG